MKPDKKVCLYCGKEIEGKKKYCDDAHRMAYKRQQPEQKDNPNTNKPEQMLPEHPVLPEQDLRSTLTKTDKTFYDRAMRDFGEPYYHYDGPERKATCGYCGKDYITNLSLNRYCSYQHYRQSLSAVVR